MSEESKKPISGGTDNDLDDPFDNTVNNQTDPAPNIDDTGENATQPVKGSQSAKKSRSSISVIALLVALAAIAGSIYLYLNQNIIINDITRKINGLDAEIGSQRLLGKSTETLIKETNTNISLLNNKYELLKNSVQTLRNNQTNDKYLLALSESGHLLQIANYSLIFEHDIDTARIALQLADKKLREADDPSLIETRQKIAEHIADLNSVTRIDAPGIIIKLIAIDKLADDLPYHSAQIIPGNEQTNENSGQSDIEQIAEKILRELRSLIVIRKNNSDIIPLLSRETHLAVITRFKMELLLARIALLNRDTKTFHISIGMARNIISENFDTNNSVANNILESLGSVDNTDIQLSVPDISAALNKLREVASKSENSIDKDSP